MTIQTATLDVFEAQAQSEPVCPCGRTMSANPEEEDPLMVHYECEPCGIRVGIRYGEDGRIIGAWRE